MLSLLEEKLQGKVAETATFLVRWKGKPWENLPAGYNLSDGDMPVAPDGRPAPAIEAEMGGFDPSRSPGREGRRQTIAEGHLRLIASIGQGADPKLITDEYGRFDALSRRNVYYDSLTVTRIYFMDARVDDGVAFYEEGNRLVRMITIPWICSWIS